MTFGPPWDNDMELGWGAGTGAGILFDITHFGPVYVQVCMDAHYFVKF